MPLYCEEEALMREAIMQAVGAMCLGLRPQIWPSLELELYDTGGQD